MDWKRKLTSRKFWVAVAEFVTMLFIALGGKTETATQITALIMAGAAVIAYIIGEGLIDAAGAGLDSINCEIYADEDHEETKPPEQIDEIS